MRNRTWVILLALLPLLASCRRETAAVPVVDEQAAPPETTVAVDRPATAPQEQVATAVPSSPYDPLDLMAPGEIIPAHRANRDPYRMHGREVGEWQLGQWANSEPLTLASLRGQVVVVRFWTDAPDELDDSLRSLKALEQLKTIFQGRPVTFVGVYHSKGSLVETPWNDVIARANASKLTLPLAYDHQWVTLSQWWRRHLDHLPTTPTFVINPAGKIVHIHPGPAYFSSFREVDALCDADFRQLRAAINSALPQSFADR